MCDPTGTCGAPTTKISCAPAGCFGAGQCAENNDCVDQGYCAPGAFCSLVSNGFSYPPGTCEMPAKLGSFTASPASPLTGVPIALTATTSVGNNPVFTFTYAPPGGQAVACGAPSPGPSCSFTPLVVGSYTVSVSVVASDESTTVPDDSQSFSIAVAQGSPLGPPVDWGNSQPFTKVQMFEPDLLMGIQVSIPAAGVLSALGVVPDPSQFGGHIQMALYSDSGGVPSSLVAFTAVAPIAGASAIPVTAPVWVEAGSYWVMAIYDTFVNALVSSTATTTAYYVSYEIGVPFTPTIQFPQALTVASLNYFAVTETP
jgi:hypothetical protein